MKKITFLLTTAFISISLATQSTVAQAKLSPQMAAANELVKQKKWPEAERAFAKVVKSEPNNERAWFFLGLSRHSQKKFPSAIEAFEKSAAISKSPISMYNIAAGYSRLNKKDEAFKWLKKALNNGAAFRTDLDTDNDFDNIKTDARFAKMKDIVKRKKNPCMYSAMARQFDFWLGDWDVFVKGNKVGENLVKLDTQGCTLVENWKNNSGGLGKSLNVYNASIKKWQQFYVSGQGSVFEFAGNYKPSEKIMHFTAETIGPDGAKIMHIFEFHNLSDKTVRQWWQQSTDGGKTWKSVWDSIYIKKVGKK